jgi:hypothetical protein
MRAVQAVRRFNRNGLHAARRFVEEARLGGPREPSFLTDDSLTEIVREVDFEVKELPTRLAAAETMDTLLTTSGCPPEVARRDSGLWTWLTLVWLPELGPISPGAHAARFVLEADDYRTYYRHYLYGAWGIYDSHREDPSRAWSLLCTPPNKPGEVVEQIASSQNLVGSPPMVQAVTDLYMDPTTGKHKTGAGGRKDGSARRLARVFQQFDLTWDLQEMTASEIIGLLPAEFNRFKDS